MTAMAPLLASAGPWLVAGLRLVPAGLALLLWGLCTGRGLAIDSRDRPWFLLFTLVDATLFQGLLARGLEGTGAGLGSVLIDCCLLYTSPSPRDMRRSRMPSSA